MVRDLFLFAVAQGSGRTAALALGTEHGPAGIILPITSTAEGWSLWVLDIDESWATHGGEVQRALAEEGFQPLVTQRVPAEEWRERVAALLPRFAGGRARVEKFLDERLALVGGRDKFVVPTVRVEGEERPALAALGRWLDSTEQTALVLGEYGSGKSTTLAKWCADLWEKDGAPRPLLCSLASAAATRDAEGLLLDAAGTPDMPANRAALRLLIQAQRILPCFDGFDEMATRVGADEMVARLSELLGVAAGGGRVVVSSREHYFESESTLRSTTAEALQRALGTSTGLTRLTVLPFAQAQIEELISKVSGDSKVTVALERIRRTYDLMDLVTRPLLLGMVMVSLDRLDPNARVAPADIYDAYLKHWLSQTREDEGSLTYAQKEEIAESLAEELWRSGETSRSWQDLRKSVRQRVASTLPEHLPPARSCGRGRSSRSKEPATRRCTGRASPRSCSSTS